MIIALEGIDNAGKTSIAEKLVSYFQGKGTQAIISKELTTRVGSTIKESFRNEGLSPIAKSFLFAADRQIRIEQLKEKLTDDKIIIFDRYTYSAIAYREAEGVDGNWVKEINRNVPKSDVCIYIDITPEESLRRNTDTKFNIRYTLEHLEKVRDAYYKYVNLGELMIIDGMKAIDDVLSDVIDVIEKGRKIYE